jgi:hypothetical protein
MLDGAIFVAARQQNTDDPWLVAAFEMLFRVD